MLDNFTKYHTLVNLISSGWMGNFNLDRRVFSRVKLNFGIKFDMSENAIKWSDITANRSQRQVPFSIEPSNCLVWNSRICRDATKISNKIENMLIDLFGLLEPKSKSYSQNPRYVFFRGLINHCKRNLKPCIKLANGFRENI